MFKPETYIQRRKRLKEQMPSGILLFLGNDESPMNYPANTYPFRQDSSFLYFWGLDFPGLAAVIDVDQNEEIVFGDDFTVDDIIWMGPQKTMAEKAQRVGVHQTKPIHALEETVKQALRQGRKLHYLPQYRAENIVKIERLSGIHNALVNDYASKDLIQAVVAQRSIKSDEEIEQIEIALSISHEMYKLAMKITKPGMYEREIHGAVEGAVLTTGNYVSFPIILTIHGETLHGHSHENLMQKGNLLVIDSGAESPLHYASDITRTIPVSGQFSELQKDIYNIVLAANEGAIEMSRPGIPYRDVHLHAAKTIADGMKQLGFIKGNTEDAVAAGAHALFFPHGLGHMMGLDVHDMEDLGENYVGYDEEFQRSDQFGLAYLRLGKRLQPGVVITVEPGIYFIPELIDQWKAQKKFTDFIDYDKVTKNRNFGGIRIEDDVLVTKEGHRVLGQRIAKTIQEIEAWSSA